MSIRIDETRCVGCKACMDICPGNLLGRGKEGKASLKRPQDCWGCAACLKECPAGAISLVLGPDMGGSGERLTVRKDGSRYLWEVDDGKGHVRKLATDTRRANGY